MGRRGAKPMPTRMKILRGNPGCRPINKDEPQPEKGRPTCPGWMRGEAKRMWKRLVPLLDGMGVLTKLEGGVLTRYCQEWAKWKEAEQFLMKNGSTWEAVDANGNVTARRRFPECNVADSASAIMNSLEGKLGLSPSDRTRLKVEPNQRMTDFDKFVGGGVA